MGCFYTGFDYKNRVNGYFKIGETSGKTPAARLARIRHDDAFMCLGYLELKSETKAERLFVESYVRMMLEKQGFQHSQNDHFLYGIEKGRKYEQAEEIAKLALDLAKEACNLANIKYEVGTREYKRG